MSATLDALAGPWLDLLMVASVQFAVVVALAALLDRTVLRGAAPRTRLALWLAVLVPLAVPLRPRVATIDLAFVAPDAPMDVADVRSSALSDVSDRAADAPPPRSVEYRPAERRERAEEVPSPERTSPMSRGTSRPEEPSSALDTPSTALSSAPASMRSEQPPTEPGSPFPWRHALAVAWIFGAALALARIVRGELRFRRVLADAVPAERRVQGLTARAARIAGLATSPAALHSDALGSPAVHGVLQPSLVVPDVSDLDDDELLAVLVHECFHVRRRDLVWMPLVSLLRAIWWFHPLVPRATRALADALEEARDRDALHALDRSESSPGSPTGQSPARLAYARVLVRFAERRAAAGAPSPDPPALAPGAIPLTRDGRGLRRRVAMIVSNPSPHRFAAVGGAALAAVVLGLGLVRASAQPTSPPTSTLDQRGAARAASEGGIHVERSAPLPEWRSDLDTRLARRLESVHFVETPLTEAFQAAARLFDLPLVVDDDSIHDEGDPTIELELSNVSGAEVLDLLCLGIDGFAWSVSRQQIRVGYADDLPYEIDLRFYRVQPILEARGIDDPDYLISFVVDFGSASDNGHRFPDSWEMEGWSIDMWRGLLAVRATEDTHRSIQAILERLLVAQHRPDPVDEPWRAPLEAALDAKVDVKWEDLDCSAALAELSKMIGAPIVHAFEHPDDYGTTFSFRYKDARVGALIQLVAFEQDRHVELADGAVLLTPRRELETRLHSIGALLELAAGTEEDLIAELDDFTQGIDAESWHDDPRCVSYRIGDVLAIRQTPKVHDQISALLAQLERALGGS
ncbi:MAG: M56 family metallopeptidase [Planctomycetota bacterium]